MNTMILRREHVLTVFPFCHLQRYEKDISKLDVITKEGRKIFDFLFKESPIPTVTCHYPRSILNQEKSM